MSLIYKPKEEQTVTLDISSESCKINIEITEKISLEFSSDCGKFGTDEMLAGYNLKPARLLEVLNAFDDYTDEELN